MIVHAGATPSTGYYFTVIKDPVTQKIFRIDDSVVVECSLFCWMQISLWLLWFHVCHLCYNWSIRIVYMISLSVSGAVVCFTTVSFLLTFTVDHSNKFSFVWVWTFAIFGPKNCIAGLSTQNPTVSLCWKIGHCSTKLREIQNEHWLWQKLDLQTERFVKMLHITSWVTHNFKLRSKEQTAVHHSNRRVALASMNMTVFKTRRLMKPLITLFSAFVQPPYF